MKWHTVDELTDVRGRYVLVRDDFNVQIVDGRIMDAFRIGQSLPTIRYLTDGGARVVIACHRGRPQGRDMSLTTRPLALALEELLGRPVRFVEDCLSRDFLADMKNGDVALLENIRFYDGEEKNDADFAKGLAEGMDYYVNDAFAVSHRAHASVDAITNRLPSFAGKLLSSEVEHLSGVIENPRRPLVGIISGAKLSSKIGVIKVMAKLCDKLVLCGVIGTAFRVFSGGAPAGLDLGDNVKYDINDPAIKNTVEDILRDFGDKLVLPVDKGVAREFAPKAERRDKLLADIESGDIIMDEGPLSVRAFTAAVATAKTVVWNGTLGLAEWENWKSGSFALARFIADRTASGEMESIIGGGDTVTALEETNTKDKMTYVSTGGGAFLEFIQGFDLPGIRTLEK